ncbi:MAG: NAD-dependent epimerase/dehydratase family protein [Clostridium sp.]
MKILITGVYGIIGSYLCEELRNEGFYVVGIGRRERYNDCDKYYRCDIINIESIEKVFKENPDIEIVIHCAALAHNKGDDLSRERFIKVNYDGTKNLVDMCNKYLNLKSFIFLSTISVYGERLNISEYREYETLNPKTPYAVSKKLSESYIRENLKGDYSILRLASVYSKNFDRNIRKRTEIRGLGYTVGNGLEKLSLCNIKNIYLVVDYLIKNEDGKNTYNISDKTPYTYKELLAQRKKRRIIIIPKFLMKILYEINKFTLKNLFIEENSIKLMSDNVYPSDEINKKVDLMYNIKDN